MNQGPGNSDEKPAKSGTREKDPLEEALIRAKLILELHKGPDDPQLRENSEHEPLEKDGAASSANDSGE